MADSPLPKTWSEAVQSLLWGTLVFAAGFEFINSLVHGKWFTSSISFLVMAVLVGAAILMRGKALKPVDAKWANVTSITDLVDFEEVNKISAYMPDKILERRNVTNLFVMGNGCSKWTRVETAIDSFRQIRRGGGNIRFMASCPLYLSQLPDVTKRKKAKRNAASLLKLREFADYSKSAGGSFVIKTYKHVATLRLIIVNETECIIGHYQENGDGDSFETPLLVFHHSHENRWGFGGAFRRMFDSEWHRATEPDAAYWTEIAKLRDQPE